MLVKKRGDSPYFNTQLISVERFLVRLYQRNPRSKPRTKLDGRFEVFSAKGSVERRRFPLCKPAPLIVLAAYVRSTTRVFALPLSTAKEMAPFEGEEWK